MKRIISWLFIVLGAGGLLLSCKTEKASKSPPAPGIVGTTSTPYYFDREITAKDLEGRTLRELSLMRNTIYARAGNGFSRKWLHDYFSSQSWYHETGYDKTKISALDRKNAETIAQREAGMPKEDRPGSDP